MSQHSDPDGSTSPSSSTPSDCISLSNFTSSDSDGSISSSDSTSSDDSWNLHHLGHVEAIPIDHDGSLRVVLRACVEMHSDGDWGITNCNQHGPKRDVCFKIPGPGNNWIASITNPKALLELRDLVWSHNTKDYEYHWYIRVDHDGRNMSREFIVESYLESEKKGRVSEGPDMIETLEERLGFMLI